MSSNLFNIFLLVDLLSFLNHQEIRMRDYVLIKTVSLHKYSAAD